MTIQKICFFTLSTIFALSCTLAPSAFAQGAEDQQAEGNAVSTADNSNTFIGAGAGKSNTKGRRSVLIGTGAGYKLAAGSDNVHVGWRAGYNSTNTYQNVFAGKEAGYHNTTGESNTYIGMRAGFFNKTGTGNVFLGRRAGERELGTGKLYIDNSGTDTPLIYGDFTADTLTFNGSATVTGYIQLATVTAAPPPTDCDEASERGRMKVDPANSLLYICVDSGWVSK